MDDLADSFDYRNKYAIIQYLKDISEDAQFKLLMMTHNFDFFRTVESRFVDYSNCLMASKGDDGIVIARASGIRNVFARDWKVHFFNDARKKIASIPFLRNLVEMTTGETDERYRRLTAMLHWMADSDAITVGNLDEIYNDICKTEGRSENSDKLVRDVLVEEAERCLEDGAGMNLENKVVLAVAIRLEAERYMIGRIGDEEWAQGLENNQARGVTEEFKRRFPNEDVIIGTLDRVLLMTPENIHVNSFMYEPIIDMSDDHLRRLFREVRALGEA